MEIGSFDSVIAAAPDISYSQKTADLISRNRGRLDNVLFFDRLMQAMGIENSLNLYPPRSNKDLRKLYQSIIERDSLDHHTQSLVYYIIKDLGPTMQRSMDFASRAYLPSKYQTFIDGIWSLDRLEFEEAVGYLADPSLVPTFPEEILYTLCKQCSGSPHIPLSYYHTVTPPILSNSKTLEALFEIMAKSSLTEAYFYSKSHEPLTRRHLFEKLLSIVHNSSTGQKRAIIATELIALPLDNVEEKWFEEFLTQGEGKSYFGAQDSAIMRRIIMGKAQEASQLSQTVKERKVDGLSWTSLTESLPSR